MPIVQSNGVGGQASPHSRYPKEILLKDGTEVFLRVLEPGDEEALVKFFQGTHISFRWFLKEDPCDPNVIKKWIDNQDKGKSFSIIATHEDRIVANASLLLRPWGGRKHVGRLRIMVAPDFQSRRLGTWIVFDLIKRAMEMGLEKLRADFVVGIEDKAIRAVRKLEFIEEGRLQDYIQDEHGNYYDYMITIKQLHKDWSDF